MTLLEQMRAKWDAAGRGAADERAPLLANWYLGNRHAWWEAMEMVKATEPTPPAVTREAVAAIVATSGYKCVPTGGECGISRDCYCRRTIDAIMALIGGEA